MRQRAQRTSADIAKLRGGNPRQPVHGEQPCVLLFLVSPHLALDGKEPAALIGTTEADRVVSLVEREARGAW